MASRTTLFGVAAAALLLATPATLADAKRQCCFSNPRYSGVCVVEPGEGETCAAILDYLNNPNSQGKSYCSNTSVRGGWKQRECEKKSGSLSPAVHGSVRLARDR